VAIGSDVINNHEIDNLINRKDNDHGTQIKLNNFITDFYHPPGGNI
jgi:hypothetical protein